MTVYTQLILQVHLCKIGGDSLWLNTWPATFAASDKVKWFPTSELRNSYVLSLLFEVVVEWERGSLGWINLGVMAGVIDGGCGGV